MKRDGKSSLKKTLIKAGTVRNYRKKKLKFGIHMSPKGDPTLDFHFKKFSQEVSLNECFILGRFRLQTPAYRRAIFTEDTREILWCLRSLDIVD